MGISLLSVNQVEAVYDKVVLALRGVSLDVPNGKIISLLGANGSGKTTTLKACSNLLAAERGIVTSGHIQLDGKDIANLSPHQLVKSGVVQVLEGRHCFGHLTVEENLLTGASVRRDGRTAIKEDLEYVYGLFGQIAKLRKQQAGYLSGGEQQMVAIGRALMARPRLILLDEPSMGLAPQLVEEIFRIVGQLNEGGGVSFLVAEQNAAIALRYAHYAYVLENGRVVMQGIAKDLAKNAEIRELYLGMHGQGRKSLKEVKFYHRRAVALDGLE